MIENLDKPERVTNSSKVQEAQKRLEALLASSFDAVIAIDTEKRITDFNRQAEDMLGYS